jgi:glycosyltransferase involved in cell wall biosynthesis
MKYLFIASDYKPWPGGIAAYIDTLARGLIRLGHSVNVLGVVEPHERERIEFLERYEAWARPFVVAHDGRPRNWLGNKCVSLLEIIRCAWPTGRRVLDRTPLFRSSAESVAQLKQIVTAERPGMVVLGNVDLNCYSLVLFLIESQLPYGILAHDVEVNYSPNRKNDLVRRGMMLKNADWVAANSLHTKSLLGAWGIEPNKIMVIHPPIPDQAMAASGEGRHGSNDVYSLLTVCRLVNSKGIDIVLRAVKMLHDRGIPCRYNVIGEGKERATLENLAVELHVDDSACFMGHVSEERKWACFRSADVFVMPSRVDARLAHEGFGIAFLEAAACGTPAVGSRAGGIPDAVIDGETGLLVKPESPEEVADALEVLYREPEKRKEMGKTAMRRARTKFSANAVASRFHQEVLKRMCP